MVDNNSEMLIETVKTDELALNFCSEFIHSDRPKFIFGRNHYAKAIAAQVNVDGFIDEFAVETEFCNKPLVKLDDLPEGVMVVSTVVLAMPQM